MSRAECLDLLVIPPIWPFVLAKVSHLIQESTLLLSPNHSDSRTTEQISQAALVE